MQHTFFCGNPALDFAGSRYARRNEEPWEALGEPADLDAWVDQSGLLPGWSGASAHDLAAALELREAIYALVWHRLHNRALPEADVAVVNRFAADPPPQPMLTAGAIRSVSGGVPELLSQLARDLIDVVGGDAARLLRECARPECTQIYLDHSRGGRREWCSMSSCGSRMKAKAYRERRKAEGDAPARAV